MPWAAAAAAVMLRLLWLCEPGPAAAELAVVGTFSTPDQTVAVNVVQGTAYVIDQSTGMAVVDVRNKAVPEYVGAYPIRDMSHGVACEAARPYCHVADGQAGVHVVHVGEPARPYQVGHLDTPGYAHALIVEDEVLYVADAAGGLQVVNVTDPAAPVKISRAKTPGFDGFAKAVAKHGDAVYLADGNAGVAVVDVATLSWPHIAAVLPARGTAVDVEADPRGGYIYVADSAAGVLIVDVTDPKQPTLRGTLGTADFVSDVSGVAGYYGSGAYHLFIACGAQGTRIFDLRDPLAPVPAGGIDWVRCDAHDLVLTAGYAYVADKAGGMVIVDVSDVLPIPTDPTPVPPTRTPTSPPARPPSPPPVPPTGGTPAPTPATFIPAPPATLVPPAATPAPSPPATPAPLAAAAPPDTDGGCGRTCVIMLAGAGGLCGAAGLAAMFLRRDGRGAPPPRRDSVKWDDIVAGNSDSDAPMRPPAAREKQARKKGPARRPPPEPLRAAVVTPHVEGAARKGRASARVRAEARHALATDTLPSPLTASPLSSAGSASTSPLELQPRAGGAPPRPSFSGAGVPSRKMSGAGASGGFPRRGSGTSIAEPATYRRGYAPSMAASSNVNSSLSLSTGGAAAVRPPPHVLRTASAAKPVTMVPLMD